MTLCREMVRALKVSSRVEISSLEMFVYNLIKIVVSCYNSKTLEWVNTKNLVLELTQENSIENFIQDCLPYILKLNGLCYYYSSLS